MVGKLSVIVALGVCFLIVFLLYAIWVFYSLNPSEQRRTQENPLAITNILKDLGKEIDKG